MRRRSPFINALSATLYISVVASVMFYGSKFIGPVDTVIGPIAMLSLFVLSAAVMGYIFCFEPVRQYLEGEKEEAVKLFLKTVVYFALITVVVFCLLFFVSRNAPNVVTNVSF